MSTFEPAAVACAACGAERRVELARSLNVTRSPEWRAEVLAGTFQVLACPTCGAVEEAVVPFAYLDFDRRQLLATFPAADEARWAELEHEAEDAYQRNLGAGAPPAAAACGAGFEVRTVFGLAALREKLVAADAGVHDGWLEVLKLRLVVEGAVPAGARPRLQRVDGGRLHLAWAGGGVAVAAERLSEVAADPVLAAEVLPRVAGSPYVDAGRLLLV